MPRRPFIRDQTTAVVLGAALFLAGSWCLYDAWERRGRRTPPIVRPFVPF